VPAKLPSHSIPVVNDLPLGANDAHTDVERKEVWTGPDRDDGAQRAADFLHGLRKSEPCAYDAQGSDLTARNIHLSRPTPMTNTANRNKSIAKTSSFDTATAI
jgi:hypothetical protein